MNARLSSALSLLFSCLLCGWALMLVATSPAQARGLNWFGCGNVLSLHAIAGSGRVVSQSRHLGDFDRIVVAGCVDAVVSTRTAQSVSVQADDNVADAVSTTVKDRTLRIDVRNGFRSRQSPKVIISMQSLKSVALEGSGDAQLSGLAENSLEASISGSGDLQASGSVGRLSVSSRGSGDIKLQDLASRDVSLDLGGSGDAHLRLSAGGRLYAVLSGSGDVSATGETERVAATIGGSGDLFCAALHSRDASIRVRGTGNARLWASQSIAIIIDGSGDVGYGGNPPHVTKKVSGSGEVSTF
ncbi:MAG: DUF2807 domain-containing protein [Candidatus Eremiobacteraeota bacterium]|nr:DUF2807 domain-containing protein [Candidatus Eremiobacteraeota bacterium]